MATATHVLRIRGPAERDGRPSFTGVGAVMAAIGTAARDATCMRFRHASRIKGRRPDWLRNAADLDAVDIQEADDRSKVVVVEAPYLGVAAAAVYKERGFWDSFPQESDTALDVLAQTVGVIAQRDAQSEWYDTHLLNRLGKIGVVFKNQGVASVALGTANGAGAAAHGRAEIDSATIDAARSLQRQSPSARRVRVSGMLDMLRHSDRAFDLLLAEGTRVRGVWEEDLGSIVSLLGRQVVVDAMAVFRPSGSLLRIEAGGMAQAGPEDAYFSRVPKPAATRLDARSVRQPQSSDTGLAAVYGKWPGEETEEQLLAALRDLD